MRHGAVTTLTLTLAVALAVAANPLSARPPEQVAKRASMAGRLDKKNVSDGKPVKSAGLPDARPHKSCIEGLGDCFGSRR
jgi:hypothetical protein